MTDTNLPTELADEVTRRKDVVAGSRRAVEARMIDVRRQLPANAYIRPGLGDLPLSTQLRAAFRLLNETLLPLIDSVEAQQSQVVQCSVCYRNLGGWPQRVLEEHYFQHSWLQRRLAKVGIR